MKRDPSPTTTLDQMQTARLGFAVMVGDDGIIPEAVLIGLKKAGYAGIEPNCFHVQHLASIVEASQRVGISIDAIPTGRWLNIADARENYGKYTKKAFEHLSEGAAIAASLDVPLIVGLIRGPGSVADDDAEAFLSSIILDLLQTRPQLKILVEPIASDEACWPHTVEQGDRFLNRLNQPLLKLLADSYNIARSCEDPHIERYRDSIGHLHIRDHRKQIPTSGAPEYASILRLWHEESFILSFEPDIHLSDTLENAVAGVHWLQYGLRQS